MNREEKVIKYYQTLWSNVRAGLCENPEARNALLYEDFSGIGKLVLDFLIENPYKHKYILSLGCGSGEELNYIQNVYPGVEITGLDSSSNALYKARKRSTNLVAASAFHLPFTPTIRFDGVVAGQIFDFFTTEELEKLFRELSLYTHQGSRLYTAMHGYPEEDGWLQMPNEFGKFLSENNGWEIINWETYSRLDLSPYAKGIFIVVERRG